MAETGLCAEENCTDCRGVCVRVYRELRGVGDDDAEAFQAAARVLELRHPGHDRDYYRGLTAQWIAAEKDN